MPTTRHFCRFCARVTTFSSKACLSCAMPIANARVVSVVKKPPPRCPNACDLRNGAGRPKEIEPDRFQCPSCGAVFECDDFSFIDDRPQQNLEKRERYRR